MPKRPESEWWNSSPVIRQVEKEKTEPVPEALSEKCELDVPQHWTQETFEIARKGEVLEGRTAHHDNGFSMVVSEKGQDVVRVREDASSRLSMALADGVSGSFLGREAARAVTAGGLKALVNGAPRPESFQEAARALDTHRIQGRSFFEHARWAQSQEDPNSVGGWLEQSAAAQYRKDDLLGSSTLDLGVFDQIKNKLSAGFSGDSPLYIYRAQTKRLEVHTGGGQLAYRARGSEAGTPSFGEFQLQEGDIFFFASDGLQQTELTTALEGRTTGEAILQGLRSHIERYGVEDDISVVGAVASSKHIWWMNKP